MLSPAQRATLKTYILANSDTATFFNDGNIGGLADILNTPASPAFFVWRTSVPMNEIMSNGFDWTRVDNLTVGKARIWDWMQQTGSINPSLANVRAGILATFGVAADLATRQAIFNHCQQSASRLEKVFAAGAGTTVSEQGIGPAALVVQGPLDYTELIGL